MNHASLLFPFVLSPFFGGGDDDPGYVLHEWGTFTTLAGSDGVLLEGLHHDEGSLPSFVHRRDEMHLGFSGVQTKMETPVIYVYSDRERRLHIRVDFPKGILTQWYPQVRWMEPAVADGPPELRGGFLRWGSLTVLAPGEGLDRIPAVSPEDPWAFARDVDANVLRLCSYPETEYERFLFYRGLGRLDLPLAAKVEGEETVALRSRGATISRPLFVRVRGAKISAAFAESVAPGETVRMRTDLPETTVENVMALVEQELLASGLYPKEAWAMVNTWRRSYFETEGLRVLYVLPRRFTDAMLPLSVEPPPRESVRVLLGRLDILTPQQERYAEATVREVGTAEEARARLGRFAEPIVRRVAETARDAELRGRAQALASALEPQR